jgi:hypothetical protein
MSTAKVKHEEKELDVAIDAIALPDGYQILAPGTTPKGFVSETYFKDELDRRGKAMAGLIKPDDAIADDGLFKRMAERRGIGLGEDLKPTRKIDPDEIKSMREQWRKEELEPVRGQLDTVTKQYRDRERNDLMHEVERAMAPAEGPKVKEALRSRTFPDQPPAIVEQLLKRFERDDERGVWFFRDGAGNPVYSENPTTANPYAPPSRLFAMLRAQNVDIFENTSPTPSGLGKPGAGGRPSDTRKASEFSLGEKMEFMKQHGADAWTKKLAEEVDGKA